MRILGIDPGTATTGWAILDSQRGTTSAVAYGCINTSKERSTSERLKEVAKDVRKIINKYKPKEAAVEDIFFFKNLKTAVKVSQSRGAMLLVLEEANIKVFEYTPLQVKQALTGYGRAEKKQVQLMVKNFFKLKNIPSPDDVADALATGICHINSRKIKALIKNK